MRDNINKVSQRGERLDSLQDKTDNLAVSAQGFRRGANRVRKQVGLNTRKHYEATRRADGGEPDVVERYEDAHVHHRWHSAPATRHYCSWSVLSLRARACKQKATVLTLFSGRDTRQIDAEPALF